MCDSQSNLGFHVSEKGGNTASAWLRSSQHQLPITGKHKDHSIIQASILKRHSICHHEKERILHVTSGTLIVIILSHFNRNNAFYCKFMQISKKPILGLREVDSCWWWWWWWRRRQWLWWCNHFPKTSLSLFWSSAIDLPRCSQQGRHLCQGCVGCRVTAPFAFAALAGWLGHEMVYFHETGQGGSWPTQTL